MFRDVRKKIVAAMFCVCMLMGMLHVSNFYARADEESLGSGQSAQSEELIADEGTVQNGEQSAQNGQSPEEQLVDQPTAEDSAAAGGGASDEDAAPAAGEPTTDDAALSGGKPTTGEPTPSDQPTGDNTATPDGQNAGDNATPSDTQTQGDSSAPAGGTPATDDNNANANETPEGTAPAGGNAPAGANGDAPAEAEGDGQVMEEPQAEDVEPIASDPIDLSTAEIVIKPEMHIYDGNPVKPKVTVKVGGESYDIVDDYGQYQEIFSAKWNKDGEPLDGDPEANNVDMEKNFIDAGRYKLTIEAVDEASTGTKSETLVIQPKDLVKPKTTGHVDGYDFTILPDELQVGEKFEAEDDGTLATLEVYDNDIEDNKYDTGEPLKGMDNATYEKKLKISPDDVKDVDYTFTIAGNTKKVGPLAVSIFGKNNYAGNMTNNLISVKGLKIYKEVGDYKKELTYKEDNIQTLIDSLDVCAEKEEGGKGDSLIYGTDYELEFYVGEGDGAQKIDQGDVSEPGSYSFKVAGKGKYAGQYAGEGDGTYFGFSIQKVLNESYKKNLKVTYEKTVMVVPRNVKNYAEYMQPEVTIMDGDYEMVPGTDYFVRYRTDDYKPTAKNLIEIYGLGKYKTEDPDHPLSYQYTIEPIQLDDVDLVELVAAEDTEFVYTGGAIRPATGTLQAILHHPDERVGDVDIMRYLNPDSFKNNKNVGLADAIYVPRKTAWVQYAIQGELHGHFEILPKDISDEDVSVDWEEEHFEYNGEERSPDPKGLSITYTGPSGPHPLILDTDYTVEYDTAINKGTYHMYIYGQGNYKGTRTVDFHINPANVDPNNIHVDVLNKLYYNHQPQTPMLEVTYDKNGDDPASEDDNIKLTLHTDYSIKKVEGFENIDAGTGNKVQVVGTGNYIFTKDVDFTIEPADISDTSQGVSAWLKQESVTYNGKEQKPEVIVQQLPYTLKEGTDYRVDTGDSDLTNATKAGEFVPVIVTGIDNYTGMKTINYRIEPCPLSRENVTAMVKEEGVDNNGFVNLEEKVFEYSAGQSYNLNEKFNGNFLVQCTETYDPELDDPPATLVFGTDYNSSYENEDKIGTATVHILGMNNYSGEATFTYEIRASLSDTTRIKVKVINRDKEYTGGDISLTGEDLEVTYNMGDAGYEPLEMGKDYQVFYDEGNDDPGKRTDVNPGGVPETGEDSKRKIKFHLEAVEGGRFAGKYTNEDELYFNIVKADLTTMTPDELTVVLPKVYYSGDIIDTDSLLKDVEIKFHGKKDIDLEPDDYTIEVNGPDDLNKTDSTVVSGKAIPIRIQAKDDSDNFKGHRDAALEILPYAITAEDVTNNNLVVSDLEAYLKDHPLVSEPSITVAKENIELSYNKGGTSFTSEKLTFDLVEGQGTYTMVGKQELSLHFTGNFTGDVNIPVTVYGDIKKGEGATYTDANGEEKQVAVIDYGNPQEGDWDYTGGDVNPKVTITYRGVELVEGADENDPAADFTVTYSGDLTNVSPDAEKGGVPTITIKGINAYAPNGAGEIPKTFEIQPCDLGLAYERGVLTLNGIDDEDGVLVYNGQQHRPLKGLMNNGIPVSPLFPEDKGGTNEGENLSYENENYTVTYSNNVNGADKDLTDESGNKIGPSVTITAKDGNPNYVGSLTAYFTIQGIDFKDYKVEVTLDDTDLSYNGTGLEPDVHVVVTGVGEGIEIGISPEFPIELAEGVDYTLEFDHNINAANAHDKNLHVNDSNLSNVSPTVKIIGKGNYHGELAKYFTIKPRVLTNADLDTGIVEVAVDPANYTGTEVKPTVTVVDSGAMDDEEMIRGLYDLMAAVGAMDGRTLVQGEKGNLGSDFYVQKSTGHGNVNVGDGAIDIIGQGNYNGTKITGVAFEIIPGTLDGAVVTLKKETMEYTGEGLEPGVASVKIGDVTVKASDYDVSYENNINVGENTAVAVVTSKDTANYQGSARATFTITPRSIGTGSRLASGFKADDIPNQILSKDGKAEPKVVLTYNGNLLFEATDYTLSYKNNTVVGKNAEVTISGTGNYKDSVTLKFAVGADIANATLKVEIAPQEYKDGQPVEPEPQLVYDGKDLKKGTDYTLSYENNIEPSNKAVVIATGTGNYGGEKRINFAIRRTFTDEDGSITISEIAPVTYTGNPVTVFPSVFLDGKELAAGTDYELQFTDNVNAGTAKGTVVGKGGYEGSTKTFEFTILPKGMTLVNVGGVSNVDYDGKVATPSVTVTDGGKTLASGTDYTVSYLNNNEPGKAKAAVSGKGNYAGSKIASFNITIPTVSNVTTESLGNGKVRISWSGSDIHSGYEVCDSTGNRVAHLSKGKTSYTVIGMESGSSRTYRIRAYVVRSGETFDGAFVNVTVTAN